MTLIMIQLLDMEPSRTPTTGIELSSVMQESPSQPPEPSMEHTISTEMTNKTQLGKETAQSASLPRGMVQTVYTCIILSAKAITQARHSLAMQEDTMSPLKHSEFIHTHGRRWRLRKQI